MKRRRKQNCVVKLFNAETVGEFVFTSGAPLFYF
jgi:hypothetical protein